MQASTGRDEGGGGGGGVPTDFDWKIMFYKNEEGTARTQACSIKLHAIFRLYPNEAES